MEQQRVQQNVRSNGHSLDSSEFWPRYTSLGRGRAQAARAKLERRQIPDSFRCYEGTRAQQNRNCVAATCQLGTHECSLQASVRNTWMPSCLLLAQDRGGGGFGCSVPSLLSGLFTIHIMFLKKEKDPPPTHDKHILTMTSGFDLLRRRKSSQTSWKSESYTTNREWTLKKGPSHSDGGISAEIHFRASLSTQ